MIIYNVTSNIDDSIHDEWLLWIKDHIPKILATGKFEKAILTKVLVDEEMGGVTYAVQYRCYSREVLDTFYRDDAPAFRAEISRKFGDKLLAFRTELEILDEYYVEFN